MASSCICSSTLSGPQADDDIYDEVEEEYVQQDEDFVEDDDNAGYIYNGVDDQHFSDEYETEADQGSSAASSVY